MKIAVTVLLIAALTLTMGVTSAFAQTDGDDSPEGAYAYGAYACVANGACGAYGSYGESGVYGACGSYGAGNAASGDNAVGSSYGASGGNGACIPPDEDGDGVCDNRWDNGTNAVGSSYGACVPPDEDGDGVCDNRWDSGTNGATDNDRQNAGNGFCGGRGNGCGGRGGRN